MPPTLGSFGMPPSPDDSASNGQRPAWGTPRVTNLTISVAGDAGRMDVPISGESTVIVDIFTGAATLTMSFVGSGGDETAQIPLPASITYSITLSGAVNILRFRSANAGATATVVVTPQVFAVNARPLIPLTEAEMLGVPGGKS